MNNPSQPIRLILIDRQNAAPGSLASALAASGLLRLVGQAVDSEDALQLCQLTAPDVVLVNIESEGLDGPAVIAEISQRWPGMTVMVLSGRSSHAQLVKALDAGAAGYLAPDSDPASVAAAISHVVHGRQTAGIGTGSPAVSVPQNQAEREREQAVVMRTNELSEAARIQTSLLPAEPPSIPGWEIAVRLLPARETSGDFYDFLALPNDRLGILIADVSDKGLGAALVMALSSTLFRTYANQHHSVPGLTMSMVNERILSDSGGSSFVTAFLGILEPHTGRFRFVNAGHIPPIMVSAQKSKSVDYLTRTGMALGVMQETNWGQKLVRFVPGDILLLYTDGLLDTQNRYGEYYTDMRLLRVVRANMSAPAQTLVKTILDDLEAFAGDGLIADDIVLMVLKRKSG